MISIRILDFIKHFMITLKNIGLADSVKIFTIARYRDQEMSIFINKLKCHFYFRGRADRGVISHLYRPGYRILTDDNVIKVIIDAGANIGVETLRFRYFHPQATIIALEPSTENFHLLKKISQAILKFSP